MSGLEGAIAKSVLDVAKKVEQQLDNEIEKLEKLDLDDIDRLREKRLKDLKRSHEQKQEWIAQGHGEYYELKEEKEFFDIMKKSTLVIVHFYKTDSARCKIVEHHFKKLCQTHLETRFIAINVEKAPFLTEKLKIRIIPTIVPVKEGIAKDYIVGFTDLGNCDDFSTELLEWRLAHSGAIKYNGDLSAPPEKLKASKTKGILFDTKKSIRGNNDDSSDDDFFEKD